MKKIILLLVFLVSAVTFTSCSKDDGVETPKDPIIGTWGYIEVYENGIKGELDNCDLQDIKVFNEDGTFSSEYYESSTGDACDKNSYTGTWKNNGDNKYTVIEGNDTLNYTITFDGDKFSFEEKDGDDLYKDVFKKK